MKHSQCSCQKENGDCPRYGWMIGFKYDICQGKNVTEEDRDKLLDIWAGKSLPNLPEKIVNFTKSLAQHAQNEFKEISKEKLQERLDICQSCDRLTKGRECNECGCPVDEKAKWEVSQCPLKKWPLLVLEKNIKSGCNCG